MSQKRRIIAQLLFTAVLSLSLFLIFYIRVGTKAREQAEIDKFVHQFEVQEEEEEGFSVSKSQLKTIGILYVPEIGLAMVIYDSTSDIALYSGAGLIDGTGKMLPFDNTNSVLTAHNGHATRQLFMNIPQLEVGDCFYIMYDNNTIHKFEIFDSKVVSPDGEWAEFLQPRQGETYVTLRTCVPIPANTHRLLLTGTYTETVQMIPQPKTTISSYEIALGILAGISGGMLIILPFAKKKKYYKRVRRIAY